MDYIPKSDAAFDSWFKHILQYVGKKTAGSDAEWPHIPAEAIRGLTEAYGVWYSAYSECLSPHSEVETFAKNNARTAAEKLIRPFKRQYLDFPPVTDEDRRAMDIHIRDTTLTTQMAPTEQSDTAVDNTENHYEHKVRAMNHEGRNTKPKGVHGVKTAYQVGGEKPATGEDLPKSKFSRKAHITITHTEADKGKPAYYATRYENAKGEGGPWSTIVEAYIG